MVTHKHSGKPHAICVGFFQEKGWLFMHKVAVLVDVGFVSQVFKGIRHPFNAEAVYNFARSFVKEKDNEELLRIFFYHGEPFDRTDINLPVSGNIKDFTQTSAYISNQTFLHELARKDNVAIRKGKTVFRGWTIKPSIIRQLTQNALSRPLTDQDFRPNIQQKGVDIKIGLDVAWISEHNDISKIILITADSDFVPAMKFARREGVQIIVGSCQGYNERYASSFVEHTDTWRKSKTTSIPNEWILSSN